MKMKRLILANQDKHEFGILPDDFQACNINYCYGNQSIGEYLKEVEEADNVQMQETNTEVSEDYQHQIQNFDCSEFIIMKEDTLF